MPEPPASTFEPTPQTSRCWTAGARRSGPSSLRSASGRGSRPRTRSDVNPRRDTVGLDIRAADPGGAPRADERTRTDPDTRPWAGRAGARARDPTPARRPRRALLRAVDDHLDRSPVRRRRRISTTDY